MELLNRTTRFLKYITLLLSILFGIIFFNGLSIVKADVQPDIQSDSYFNLYDNLTPENQQLMMTLDQYIAVDNNGSVKFNLQKAKQDQQSIDVLNVGNAINDLSLNIEAEGYTSTVNGVFRALFPIGSYGNYCGKGNNGWNKKPVDDLDAACRAHDVCFKGFNAKSKSCNRAFISKLRPIANRTPITTYKGVYARAAIKLFSVWT